MSRTMLPNSSPAIPKPGAERAAVGQPSVSEIWVVEDPPDEPGAEMATEARVWRTYVREADRSDKGMVEGRTNSLDVLLIFAALFSAVSTAFIIESLSDLKPDPAELSAHTLLAMSQALISIANNQPVSPPARDESTFPTFSPSPSAVVVNVLWLLSLSLSVAVSLVAMLAKGWWCKFISGRSGPIYEQARRRQEKWDGMERWKMTEVLTYLPGAMNLALLLFAVGMCVYPWDINISVATPVIVITVIASLAYAFATILPAIDRFCPYSTPATAPAIFLATIVVKSLKLARFKPYSWVDHLFQKTSGPGWLKSTLWRLRTRLQPDDASYHGEQSIIENSNVPMDIVTSRMLAWLITNCEDSRSVDIALQAISGAHDSLPLAPLVHCAVLNLAVSRLQSCAKPYPGPKDLSVEEQSLLAAALRYGRACVRLMSGYNFRIWGDEWDSHIETVDRPAFSWDIIDTAYHAYRGFLELGDQNASTTDMLAIAVSAVMPHCHWGFRWDAWNYFDKGHPRPALHTMQHIAESSSTLTDKARETLLSMLNQHFQEGSTTLSPPTLHLLVKSSAHYLVGRWPNGELQGPHIQLLVLLARAVLTSYNTAPDTAYAAAITLAAAAFACDTYPGGEGPTSNDDAHNARKKRAVSVLRYYQTKKPNEAQVLALFIFGLFGLLPQFILNGYDAQLATMVPLLGRILQDSPSLLAKISLKGIRTMPEQFTLVDHAFKPLSRCLSSGTDAYDDRITPESACLIPLLGLQLFQGDLRTYLVALIALCRTVSAERRKQYMIAIDSQWIFYKPLGDLKLEDGGNLLGQLCRILLDNHSPVTSVAAPHFGLVVANIVSSQDSLNDRQSALRPLLGFCDRFPGLKEPSPLNMSNLVSHIDSSITNWSTCTCLEHTMQSVVDFCGAGLSLNQGSGTESGGKTPNVNWQGRLQDLKSRYRPDLEDLEPWGTEELGDCSPVSGATEESIATSGIVSCTTETVGALQN